MASEGAMTARYPHPSIGSVLGALLQCAQDVADQLGRYAVQKRYGAKDTLVAGADAADVVHLMSSGLARATLFTMDGRLVHLCDYTSGDIFGALEATGLAERREEVVALDDTVTYVFPPGTFFQFAERHAALALALARALSRQMAQVSDRLMQRSTISANGRVYAELLRLAAQHDGLIIPQAPSVSALAERVQTTRETASRAISAIERRGILKRDGDRWELTAPRMLEQLVL